MAKEYGELLDKAMSLLSQRSLMLQGEASQQDYNSAAGTMSELTAKLHLALPEQRAIASKLITMGLDSIEKIENNREVGLKISDFKNFGKKNKTKPVPLESHGIETKIVPLESHGIEKQIDESVVKPVSLREQFVNEAFQADADFISSLSYGKDFTSADIDTICQRISENLKEKDNGDGPFILTKTGKEAKAGIMNTFFKFVPVIVKKKLEDKLINFVILEDRPATFLPTDNRGVSMGPNIVSTTKYDTDKAPRVNLFQDGFDKCMQMLVELIVFRKRNETSIFMTVVKNLPQREYINGNNDYRNMKSLLEFAYKQVEDGKSLEDMGLGLISFCQTWDAHGMPPNFSMASPHFQTRVYIKYQKKFLEWSEKNAKDVSDELIQSYKNNMIQLTMKFVREGYMQKFVDLDALYYRMRYIRDI